MRLVLDTNVVLSALLWRGTPYRLLEAIKYQPTTQLFASTVLLDELADVLTRPAIAKRLTLSGRTTHQLLGDYADAVELVFPAVTPKIIPADADDDHVIAAAVEARADLIVSGDHHLLDLVRHGEIRIVTPADTIRLLGEAAP